MKNKIAVILCIRNEENKIRDAINCILNQTVELSSFVVVDDGSNDQSYQIINEDYVGYGDNIDLLKRRDRGYSALGTYLMADVYNDGFRVLMKDKEWNYLLISSADTFLPPDYVERVIEKMDGCGVAGGEAYGINLNPEVPTGAGRIVRRSVMEGIGGSYPRNYAWEESTIWYSKYVGLETKVFKDIKYTETRRQGGKRKMSYIGWGRGMKDNGMHQLYVYRRLVGSIIKRNPRKGIEMLVGYYAHRSWDSMEWKSFVADYQKKRFIAEIRNKIRRIIR